MSDANKRLRSLSVWVLATLLVALSIGACGDDGDKGPGAQGPGAQGAGTKKGGAITIALASQPDYLDPALSYTSDGWQSLWEVYTPLLVYPHKAGAAGAKLIPGLAERLPEISADGKTYELKLRRGLKYSDGTPVKASDFERTIQRVLNLESGGSFLFSGIVGADAYVERGDADGNIKGIETDDETGAITIKLAEPDGTFQSALATTFAGLVPGDTKFKNLTKDPPPGVGPYKITKSVPNRQFVLEKDTSFSLPGVSAGNLDTITVKIVKSQERQVQDALKGKLDYVQAPPTDLLRELRTKYKDLYREYPTNSIYFFFLNSRVAPFDKLEVRQAANLAVDKSAIARLYGGLIAPTCNFLPPNMVGYAKLDPCPYGDPGGPANVEKAKQLVEQAGAKGAKVSVWGTGDDPTPQVVEYYADALRKIGLDAKPKIVDGGVYGATVGNQKTKAQTGFTNWFQDYPHPANFMSLVDGTTIQETNNQNLGNVDDKEITAGIERLKKEPDLGAVAGQWAELDKKLIERAYLVPYGNRELTLLFSKRMNIEDCTVVHALYDVDLASLCLK